MDTHTMKSMDPNSYIDTTLALKHLTRQSSCDSVYDSQYGDSYVLGSGTYYLPTSPTGRGAYTSLDPALPSIAEEADPEKDDIFKHMRKNREAGEVGESLGSEWSML